MSDRDIFATDYSETPYWWRDAPLRELPRAEPPAACDVVVIGGGYAGLNAAMTLADHGRSVCVLEAQRFGEGASSRNGGMVSGGANVGKSTDLARKIGEQAYRELLLDARESLDHFERVIADEGIDCDHQPVGRFTGAWTPKHYAALKAKAERLSRDSGGKAYLVPLEQQHEYIGSERYFGGMVVERTAGIQPARYLGGLLDAALRRGVTALDRTPALGLSGGPGNFEVTTPSGAIRARDVLVSVNGYANTATRWERNRTIPVASDAIATEEIGEGRVRELFPQWHMMGETKRILNYFRPSPDRKRVIFGGRATFAADADVGRAARILHGRLVTIFPQLEGVRLSHAWSGNVAFTFRRIPHMGVHDGVHFCFGCNGSGVAMMSYLGHRTAEKLLGVEERPCGFERMAPLSLPFYAGRPWFLPAVGSWWGLLDRLERQAVGGA
ncbi:FAD-dependent oxidoreductase (plasmid) [Thalassobaculum sp. OXR-137]|uniref:NAD(P)/FAD-dependent oxidoreductase n=1 Tax=Thalassobaculum sp. OXR-137 TaxID=3100173 RepID=UPI002AC916E9|nr:FAD-dependent oxidoreductase [Thalassobaculum sp. OXR-137]WPZ37185.1 FAD-dependent oxidoreductase [Thalassobaculum sp. OXR-137]